MRGDATITVNCDRCLVAWITVQLAEGHGSDDLHVDAAIERQGWLVTDDKGEDICPHCR